MKLHIHSDVSYYSAFKVINRVGVHFFLNDNFDPSSPTKHNAEVLVLTSILKNVMASAAESEFGRPIQ